MPAPISVLHLSHDLAGGGQERVAVDLSNHLAARGHSVHLGTWAPSIDDFFDDIVDSDVHRARLAQVPMRPDSPGGRMARRFLGVPQLIRYLVRHRIQIVHSHRLDGLRFAGIAASVVPGTRVVWHHHDGDPHRVLGAVDRSAIRVAKLVVVAAGSMVEWAASQPGVGRTRVVHVTNFSDLEPHAGPAVELPGAPGSRIVCVANLRSQKDHMTLMRAMAVIAEREPRAHLLVVGDRPKDGPGEAIRAEIATLGIGDRVSILGRRHAIAAVLGGSTVGVLASRFEATPLALLEYGRAGLPAVVTDVGDMGAVVDHGRAGTVVPPGDPDALAEGILAYLADPAAAGVAATALQERVHRDHSASRVVDQLEELYREVLRPKGPRLRNP